MKKLKLRLLVLTDIIQTFKWMLEQRNKPRAIGSTFELRYNGYVIVYQITNHLFVHGKWQEVIEEIARNPIK